MYLSVLWEESLESFGGRTDSASSKVHESSSLSATTVDAFMCKDLESRGPFYLAGGFQPDSSNRSVFDSKGFKVLDFRLYKEETFPFPEYGCKRYIGVQEMGSGRSSNQRT